MRAYLAIGTVRDVDHAPQRVEDHRDHHAEEEQQERVVQQLLHPGHGALASWSFRAHRVSPWAARQDGRQCAEILRFRCEAGLEPVQDWRKWQAHALDDDQNDGLIGGASIRAMDQSHAAGHALGDSAWRAGRRRSAFVPARALGCAALVLAVTSLSAFIRLSKAGLSCADWPRCYAQGCASCSRAGLPRPARTRLRRRALVHRSLRAPRCCS